MKLVIDIPDKAYELLKNKQVLDNIAESIIANGKPYEETQQGEWVYGEDDSGQDGWFCSKCGFFVPWYYQYYEKDVDFIRDYKVCPHCVSKMITYTGKDKDAKGGAE